MWPVNVRVLELLRLSSSLTVSLCNFQVLRINLIKKLTNLTSAKCVLSVFLSPFNCIHYYFHETRPHQQDGIWRKYYGPLFSSFQCHLGHIMICGNCVKNNMQGHETILYVIDTTICRFY